MVIDKVTKEILMKFAVGDQKVDKDTYGWQFKAVIGDPIEGTMARSLTITRLA